MFSFVVRSFLVVSFLLLYCSSSVLASQKPQTSLMAVGQHQSIAGTVFDENNNPLNGVSIILRSESKVIAGTFSNNQGGYILKFDDMNYKAITLTALMIGYEYKTINIDILEDNAMIDFRIKEKPVEMAGIVVKPEKDKLNITYDKKQIVNTSKQSLFATNPISVINQPQVVREGSIHSSKIRVNGTNPKYYLNGMDIGYDPCHYGMFSIIPSGVIDKVEFQAQGTPSMYGLPSVVAMNTLKHFSNHTDGAIDMSVIEATGFLSIGSDDYYVISSLRKSLLDKLVKQLDNESERNHLPPTNFQDIFISSGVKLSDSWRLMLDQYFVRDYLAYDIKPTINNPSGIKTNQDTKKTFTGLRFERICPTAFIKLTAAFKSGSEKYKVWPSDGKTTNGLFIDLAAKNQTLLTRFKAELFTDKLNVVVGNESDYTFNRKIDLTQNNWNFQPPDASSDIPYIYQPELNQLYGEYSSSDSELNTAGYFSLKHDFSPFEIEVGLRVEYFSNLMENTATLYRNRAVYKNKRWGDIEFFYGAFAENPIKNILEPYQVMVHAGISKLKPLKTRLAKISYIKGPFKFGLFKKRITNIPYPTPDFSHVNDDNSIGDGFIEMMPNEQLVIYGGDIDFHIKGFLLSKLDFTGYYGYSHAMKAIDANEVPYELNAPHRIFMQLNYKLLKSITIGSELSLRSGYPYTPTYPASTFEDNNRCTPEYYSEMVSLENSERFPQSAVLNLHADFNINRFNIFLSILNLTNHGNALINTNDGYVYDTGILPSLGIRYGF
ncbi:MAG: TonB-dependent receptor [candidate division Zixibacteria bacterium]|nr:TonB-dependent receptor [candidate division Zixibacteria bacterium]